MEPYSLTKLSQTTKNTLLPLTSNTTSHFKMEMESGKPTVDNTCLDLKMNTSIRLSIPNSTISLLLKQMQLKKFSYSMSTYPRNKEHKLE